MIVVSVSVLPILQLKTASFMMTLHYTPMFSDLYIIVFLIINSEITLEIIIVRYLDISLCQYANDK